MWVVSETRCTKNSPPVWEIGKMTSCHLGRDELGLVASGQISGVTGRVLRTQGRTTQVKGGWGGTHMPTVGVLCTGKPCLLLVVVLDVATRFKSDLFLKEG